MSGVTDVAKKMLMFTALMSNYDYFHVIPDNQSDFYCTAIYSNALNILEFERCFAASKFSNGAIAEIKAVSETVFIIIARSTTYQIEALHKKEQRFVDDFKTFDNIYDLMDTTYFNNSWTSNSDDSIVMVIDPAKLGELDSVKKSMIARILNMYFDGLKSFNQFCRTVYFRVMKNNLQHQIYAGLYNLETMSCNGDKLIYDNDYDVVYSDEYKNKCKNILDYALLQS